ncbi:MAG: FAD-binding protein, partial [Actinomycetales bacterium]|nr:FAD-binding protein [Actinomycetales bacterium]
MTAPLADLTSLRVGGPARTLRTAETEAEIIDAVRAADSAGTLLLILGGGTNVVIDDGGFPGDVLLVRTRGVDVS